MLSKPDLKNLFYTLLAMAVFFTLLAASQINYLLFHSLAEGLAIVIGAVIFVIAVNTRKLVSHDLFLFLGISFAFVSVIELLHTLTFKGVNIIPNLSTNEPTQLWLAGRYLFALALLIAPVIINKKLSEKLLTLVILGFSLLSAATLLAVFQFKVFPAAYAEGTGLTAFKIYSEYAIIVLLAGAIASWNLKSEKIDRVVYYFITLSLIFAIFAELCFTRYVSVYSSFNMLGHLLLIASYYCTQML